MTQEHYNMYGQQTAISDQNELMRLRAELDQAHAEIARLRANFQHTVEQSNAERDEALQKLIDTENRNVWLEEQNLTLTASKEYLSKDLEWLLDVLKNNTIEPAKKTVLQILYPFAKSGEWFSISIKKLAWEVGVWRGTFSSHLHALGDLGHIEVEGGTWFTGEYDKKGNPIYKTEVTIRFSEELLHFPGEIRIEKEDDRKNNGKGKAARKPKKCKCGSLAVEELDAYRCKDCGHQWEEGQPKDANAGVKITPWDYSPALEEDAAELALAKEFEDQAAPPVIEPPAPEWEDVFSPPVQPPVSHGTCIVCSRPKIMQNMAGHWICETDHTLEE